MVVLKGVFRQLAPLQWYSSVTLRLKKEMQMSFQDFPGLLTIFAELNVLCSHASVFACTMSVSDFTRGVFVTKTSCLESQKSPELVLVVLK